MRLSSGAASDIRLRPEAEIDLAFLRALYASSREREMALLVDWSAEQKQTFLDSQFAAQRGYYREHYPDADFDIIERAGCPIGRFYIASTPRQLILMDITLLAAERNSGLGNRLVRELQARALCEQKIVSLHVEDDNPARRLYDRLGFGEVATVTFYKLMHWVPMGLEAVSESLAPEVRAR